LKYFILLFTCLLVFAEAVVGQQLDKSTQSSISDAIQIQVSEDPDNTFHVRILAPMYIGKEQFEILALHGRAAGGHAMEVGIVVEETSDLTLEGWMHVVGTEELQRYSLHVYYSVPCAVENQSGECRREYVFEPIDFVKGKAK